MLSLMLSLSLLFGSSVALADRIEPVAAEYLFVPTGFDDNDQTQAVVDGFFPNSCYQVDSVDVAINQQETTVYFTPKARILDGLCLNVLVPFTYVAEVGVLPKGIWKVQLTTNSLTKDMPVAESTSAGPDSELYAALDNTYIVYDAEARRDVVVLEGRYTNSCMSWQETRVIHNSADVIEVLPIVALNEGPDCIDGNFPFKGVKASLPTLASGRYLLHARSMHGGALNRVFSVEAANQR